MGDVSRPVSPIHSCVSQEDSEELRHWLIAQGAEPDEEGVDLDTLIDRFFAMNRAGGEDEELTEADADAPTERTQ